MSYRREGVDSQHCRTCGDRFNLNAVPYYDNQCPRCRAKAGTTAQCPFCGDDFNTADGVTTTHRHTNGRTESLVVCSETCADDDENRGRR